MKKTLLSGNEAVALGAYEAGVRLAAAYPGTPSTEILASAASYAGIDALWSSNEKVALETAWGASLAGVRTLAAMKHVGVNVAMDVLINIAITGVNGGLVLVSADDPGQHSSQNEQDNRIIARFCGIPLIEPSDSQEAKDSIAIAFEMSERFDTPVMVRLTTRIAHAMSLVELGERKEPDAKPYQKNIEKNVLLPVFSRQRREIIAESMPQIQAYNEQHPTLRMELEERERPIGVITSGVTYQYVREVLPSASILKILITNPLPQAAVRKFAGKVKRLFVVEELEPFLEEQILAMGINVEGKRFFPRTGELTPLTVRRGFIEAGLALKRPDAAVPVQGVMPRPPVMCPGCPHRGMMAALRTLKGAMITGDIGCYNLGANPPFGVFDTTVCMGASIGTAIGFARVSREKKVVAVIGDSTFLHTGLPGLVDAVYQDSSFTLVLVNNRVTAMTGGQPNPASGTHIRGDTAPVVDFEAVCRSLGIQHVETLDSYDLAACRKALQEAMEKEGLKVIITDRPCVMYPEKIKGAPLDVKAELCDACGRCYGLGCPAIKGSGVMGKKYQIAQIVREACTGCGLCQQVCPVNAIQVNESQNLRN
jgi:indolepyruvate ferredoxin oxidoreductase alpha subunit